MVVASVVEEQEAAGDPICKIINRKVQLINEIQEICKIPYVIGIKVILISLGQLYFLSLLCG